MRWYDNGLAGWAILSAIWGVLSIGYDTWIEITLGTTNTISWQTQLASISNPVIPAAVGFVIGGLTIHFFKVRALPWLDADQPWWYWLAGFVAGAVLVWLSWTQRG